MAIGRRGRPAATSPQSTTALDGRSQGGGEWHITAEESSIAAASTAAKAQPSPPSLPSSANLLPDSSRRQPSPTTESTAIDKPVLAVVRSRPPHESLPPPALPPISIAAQILHEHHAADHQQCTRTSEAACHYRFIKLTWVNGSC
ncbi:hypothetical protein Dimus_016416 [Dionaea muscipula]